MAKHQVVLSCGTKFHSDHVAFQLQKHQLLKRAITSHPQSRYLNRVSLSKTKVIFLPPVFVLPYVLKKIPLIGHAIARLIEYRLPAIFDYMASFYVKGASVSFTWAWAGLYTINQMKKQNGIAIMEKSGSCNQYQNQLLQQEYESLGLQFSSRTPDYIIRRELKEADKADYILCPSQYVADSFTAHGITQQKLKVIPYGVNLSRFTNLHLPKPAFKIIFVGTIGVRKGLIYLFKALELLEPALNIECILIGPVENEFKPIFKRYQHLFTYIGPVAQSELVQYYNKASVLVFPSIDEGMALVQLEAMACGLPVITTTNAGADQVITDGVEGFIVPIRNPELLSQKIAWLYHHETERLQMGANAEHKAKAVNWDNYGQQLAAFIKTL